MKLYNEILNRVITLSDTPKRIVSFCPSITETLIKLGKIDNVIGVSAYCAKFLRELRKPIVGSYVDEKSEALGKMKPDLILTMGPAQLKLSKRLHEIGFCVFPLRLPTSLYGIIENIINIGLLVDEYNKAHEVAFRLLDLLKETSKRKPSRKPYIYFEADLGEPYSVGALTFTDGLIYLAGGLNIFSNKKVSYFRPDFNEVMSANPDVLIFEFKNVKKRKDVYKLVVQRGWSELAAVRHKRILELRWPGSSLTHPGPSAINTANLLSEKIREILSS
jgi:ABC-type Fe3+-hydroxamate transport system substrate-binding protein